MINARAAQILDELAPQKYLVKWSSPTLPGVEREYVDTAPGILYFLNPDDKVISIREIAP